MTTSEPNTNPFTDSIIEALKTEAWEAFKFSTQQNNHEAVEDEVAKQILRNEFKTYWAERLKILKSK